MDYVERIINTWDPIGLFPYSPVDEYHDEIDHIKCILATATNATELSEGIYSIFVDSFGTGIFKRAKVNARKLHNVCLRTRALNSSPHVARER